MEDWKKVLGARDLHVEKEFEMSKRNNGDGELEQGALTIASLTDELFDGREVDIVARNQEAWGNGDLPKILGGSAEYFYLNKNDPAMIVESVQKIRRAESFQELEELCFGALFHPENGDPTVVGVVDLIPNHDKRELEFGRAATDTKRQKNGVLRAMTEQLRPVMNATGYLLWADANTMHRATQKICNRDLEMTAVGFNPLKYFIPSHERWTSTDPEGIIYFDGRVSVVNYQALSPKQKSMRTVYAHAIDEVVELQELVCEQIGVDVKNRASPYTWHERSVTRKPEAPARQGNACNWWKLDGVQGYSIQEVIDEASRKNINYVEVDVVLEPNSLPDQQALIDHGFFVGGYLSGGLLSGDGTRHDVARFCYIVDKKLHEQYVNKIGQVELEALLIDSAQPIGALVMENMRKSRR